MDLLLLYLLFQIFIIIVLPVSIINFGIRLVDEQMADAFQLVYNRFLILLFIFYVIHGTYYSYKQIIRRRV